jgi:hypothetical protein
MKKRIMLLITVALVTAAMMVATAMPALAVHEHEVTPHDCRDTAHALYRGEELTAQQQQIIQQYPSFGACVQANILAGTD